LPGTNALAYFVAEWVTKKRKFYNVDFGSLSFDDSNDNGDGDGDGNVESVEELLKTIQLLKVRTIKLYLILLQIILMKIIKASI
jgi:hypothetical protein